MTLPVFETPRLILKSITERDAEGLHEAYGDADAMRHWDLPPSVDVSQTAERIRLSAEADSRWHGMWAIQTHGGRFAGAINYHAHNEHHRRLALGWIVVPSFWRQGIMTEAAPPVISLLHAPERASHRSSDRAGERVVTAAGCEVALHRGGPAARLALRRRRVPQRGDV